MKKRNPKIYLVCGKAKSGKDTVSKIIQKNQKNSIILSITDPLKEYSKKISNWDGREESKPRNLLQELGIDLIKNQIDSKLLIRRIIEDIQVMSYYKDCIIVSGVRLKEEILSLKYHFENVISIKVKRPDFDNGLTMKQKEHITEQDLDDFQPDYQIINDSDLNQLNDKVLKILKEA